MIRDARECLFRVSRFQHECFSTRTYMIQPRSTLHPPRRRARRPSAPTPGLGSDLAPSLSKHLVPTPEAADTESETGSRGALLASREVGSPSMAIRPHKGSKCLLGASGVFV